MEQSKIKLNFLNHVSFYLESSRSILLIDPWLEGKAFANGWALLDQTTSNMEIIDRFKKINNKIVFLKPRDSINLSENKDYLIRVSKES